MSNAAANDCVKLNGFTWVKHIKTKKIGIDIIATSARAACKMALHLSFLLTFDVSICVSLHLDC